MRTTVLCPVSWKQVKIGGGFWGRRAEINRQVTLAAVHEQFAKKGTLQAYQWEWWDQSKGDPPWKIWVGDLGKWIEAASYSLAVHPDAQLDALMESVIEGMLKGQKEDGYLYSNPIPREYRWANLQECHELYDVGHAIEAAVAHYQATGRRHLLDAMCRCADLIDACFGPQDGKKRGYDGHPEIELALVKLYRATGERRYLNLAKFFIDERGRQPCYFDLEIEELKRKKLRRFGWFAPGSFLNVQAHVPLREQREAVGHAVRAMYLYCGAADVAAASGDAELLQTCRRLWRSATRRRMYVIGGIGSTAHGEAFSFDYDLPNETAYAETCSNISLLLFAHRMLQIDADSEYADVMERALYNGILSGVSLDGRRFFYANHLTAFPQASVGARDHVAVARQEWFGCACCPPNIARLIASLGQHLYSQSERAVYVHLYAQSTAEVEVAGQKVTLAQKTDYPWCETVELNVRAERPARFTLALRIPGWCHAAALKVNGRPVKVAATMKRGYTLVDRMWTGNDSVELTLPMPIERIEANPRVRMDCGKVALQRGPIVYCLEEADNGQGLADVFLPRSSKLRAEYRPRLLGGCVVIRGRARRRDPAAWDEALYRSSRSKAKSVDLTAVPYCLWANREPGEMLVWIRGD